MTETSTDPGTWYWCLSHSRAEDAESNCPPDDRLGPYESRDAAERWRERSDARNDKWDKEDQEWSGDAG